MPDEGPRSRILKNRPAWSGSTLGMPLAPLCRMDLESTPPSLPTSGPAVETDRSADAPPSEKRLAAREFVVIALAVVGGGVITFALMGRPVTPLRPEGVAPSAPAAEPAPRATASDVRKRPWSAARRELWLGERRKGVAFDIDANEPVSAWMKMVRPILVVRCIAGTMETFVVTDTAAQIEARTEAHTVRLRFDGQASSSERWPDSEEHDALFAPDGAALAARLAGTQVFEFGFTPHNASPVVARFSVAGLAPLLEPAAKHCGPQVAKH